MNQRTRNRVLYIILQTPINHLSILLDFGGAWNEQNNPGSSAVFNKSSNASARHAGSLLFRQRGQYIRIFQTQIKTKLSSVYIWKQRQKQHAQQQQHEEQQRWQRRQHTTKTTAALPRRNDPTPETAP